MPAFHSARVNTIQEKPSGGSDTSVAVPLIVGAAAVACLPITLGAVFWGLFTGLRNKHERRAAEAAARSAA